MFPKSNSKWEDQTIKSPTHESLLPNRILNILPLCLLSCKFIMWCQAQFMQRQLDLLVETLFMRINWWWYWYWSVSHQRRKHWMRRPFLQAYYRYTFHATKWRDSVKCLKESCQLPMQRNGWGRQRHSRFLFVKHIWHFCTILTWRGFKKFQQKIKLPQWELNS